VWDHNRPEERYHVQLELLTTYEPLARFSRSLLALVNGSAAHATLEGEAFPRALSTRGLASANGPGHATRPNQRCGHRSY